MAHARRRRLLAVVVLAIGCGSTDTPAVVAPVEPDVSIDVPAPPDDLDVDGGPDVQELPDLGAPDLGVDIEEPLCEPLEPKGTCAGSKSFHRCNAAGTAWDEVACDAPLTCYQGKCVDIACEPGATMCEDEKSVATCMADADGKYAWVVTQPCDDNQICRQDCKGAACVKGCVFDVKGNYGADCELWNLEFTSEPGKVCASEKLLAMPSSGNNKLAVFDIAKSPPEPLAGTPFATCQNPSRILIDGDSNIVATCRDDGKVQKHTKEGVVLWAKQLPDGCTNGARGVVITPSGRLFAGCSSSSKVYELDPETGAVLKSVAVSGYVYGLTADADGLYVALYPGNEMAFHLDGPDDLTEMWTKNEPIYGFAVDGQGSLWLGGASKLRSLDTKTGDKEAESEMFEGGATAYGVAVGLDGNIYAGLADVDKVAIVSPDGLPMQYIQLPSLGGPFNSRHPRGLALDADDNIYTINMNSNDGVRIDAITKQLTTFATNTLQYPYGYSGDMTGLTSGCLVKAAKTWKSPLVEGGSPNAMWIDVNWGATTPPGTSVSVYYRIDTSTWTQVFQDNALINKTGEKLQIKAVLLSEDPLLAPTLHWIAVSWEP